MSTDASNGTGQRSLERRVIIAGVVAVIALLAGLWWALAQLRPLPPRVVAMSTGPEGGAFAEVAQQYRKAFAEVGIELKLVPSAGSVENLARLKDPNSDVAAGFAEGGLAQPADSASLVSLGTLFHEPVWFFAHARHADMKLRELVGKRISIGPEGSGTRAFSLRLLALNGISEQFATLLAFPPQEAAERFLSGDLEALVVLTSWESPVIRRLFSSRDTHLFSFPRADAYVALFPHFSKLTLPMGVGNIAENRPPEDVTLIAAKATLVVRKDLHPAVQYLFLDAATRIHGGPGIFHKAGQFPAAEAIDLPLSEHARTFYTSGRPFLQRYLPFWMAVLAGQLLVFLIPVLGVLYPVMRLAPAIYGWIMRRRIFRLYGDLKSLEDDLDRLGPAAKAELRARLERLEQRANRMAVPLAFRQLQYTLRLHIGLVRARLE